MKVLLLASLYPPYVAGGAEIIAREHASVLRNHGVDVAVLTLGPNPGFVKDEVDGITVWRGGIRNIYFPYGPDRPPGWQRLIWHLFDIYNPFAKSYIRQVIQEFKPDIACCHNILGWSVAVWDVFAEYSIPIVQVLHDQYLLCPKCTMFRNGSPCRRQCLKCRLMRRLHRVKSSRVDAVVGVSQFVLEKLLDFEYFLQTPIKEIVHNTREFPFEPSELPPRKPDGDVVFGFIGALGAHKGIELLLETFSSSAAPNWRLIVAGSGKTEYEAGLKTRFTNGRIAFLGHCPQEDFFTRVDAVIAPSLWEDTFPGVVFESFLFGVPVIGSQRGGIPEMITPGVTGLLFEPGHPGSLLEAMLKLSDDIDRFRSSRGTIMLHAAKFRDQRAWAEKWITIFEQTLALHR